MLIVGVVKANDKMFCQLNYLDPKSSELAMTRGMLRSDVRPNPYL